MNMLIDELNKLLHTDRFNTENISNLSTHNVHMPKGITLPAFCAILFPVEKKSG
jgi:hypothetical protein